jgi:hypothetical protein
MLAPVIHRAPTKGSCDLNLQLPQRLCVPATVHGQVLAVDER